MHHAVVTRDPLNMVTHSSLKDKLILKAGRKVIPQGLYGGKW
jgi:hypothetical protein